MAIVDLDWIAWRDQMRTVLPQAFDDVTASRAARSFREEIAKMAFAAGKAAALSRSEVPAGWQPIETAPRDGSGIFAWWGTDSKAFGIRSFGVTLFRDGEWRDPDDEDETYGEPTHWQPLPTPPAKAEVRSED